MEDRWSMATKSLRIQEKKQNSQWFVIVIVGSLLQEFEREMCFTTEFIPKNDYKWSI